MKIHFAHRSAYLKSNRFLKTFDAPSIMGWFQENWETLHSDQVDDFLGRSTYMFPLSKPETHAEHGIKAMPETLQDLIEYLPYASYIMHAEGDEGCLFIDTDDDEIQLSCYIFTDQWARENPDRTAIWFEEPLPLDAEQVPLDKGLETDLLTPEDRINGAVFFVANGVYDSGNYEDLCSGKFTGARLSDFLSQLRHNGVAPTTNSSLSLELDYIRHIANELNSESWQEVGETFVTYPSTVLYNQQDVHNEGIESFSMDTLKSKISPAEFTPDRVRVAEHCVELAALTLGYFNSYYVLFDDIWAASNPELARSLLHFGNNENMRGDLKKISEIELEYQA